MTWSEAPDVYEAGATTLGTLVVVKKALNSQVSWPIHSNGNVEAILKVGTDQVISYGAIVEAEDYCRGPLGHAWLKVGEVISSSAAWLSLT